MRCIAVTGTAAVASAVCLSLSMLPATSQSPSRLSATGGCYRDGDVITVQGVATAQALELANGLVRSVWLLATDKPICVVEADTLQQIRVSRLQIIGQPPPSGVAIELTGKLSTGNITQYYAVSTAIDVISGRRIAMAKSQRSTAPPSVGRASAPQPFAVAIETSVSGGARPIVTGTTNLPDGTNLMVFLRMDAANLSDTALSACGDICSGRGLSDGQFPVIRGAVVMNGQFRDGPITYKGSALPSGTYVLEISTFPQPGFQPPDVLAILGPRGENMTGPLVGACCFAPSRRQDQAFIQETKQLAMGTSTTGPQVYYARYVTIGPN
jgi:hypothetical protein